MQLSIEFHGETILFLFSPTKKPSNYFEGFLLRIKKASVRNKRRSPE